MMSEFNTNTIALLTDFGLRGQHYVASMKGVILSVNPKVNIVDISHNISPFSIIEASYLLRCVYRYFPKGTVFIIVVDPGVGTSREILIIKSKDSYFFVGPNNGIFPNVLCSENIEKCIEVKNSNYFRKPVSNTFHGRDIMAPIGAYITKKIPLSEFGDNFDLEKLIKKSISYEIIYKENKVKCIIQYIDSFGNITTNIPIQNGYVKKSNIKLKDNQIIEIHYNDNVKKGRLVPNFSSVNKGELLFLVGSTGFIEISINQGSAAQELNLNVGDHISFYF